MNQSPINEYQPIALPDRVQMDTQEALNASDRFLGYMKKRHSVRHYSSRAVPQQLIQNAIATAGSAPSGANQQPWHFVAIQNHQMKAKIRQAAEKAELDFYDGGGGDAWIKALEPIGTGPSKPHLTDAPWLIIVFAQRFGLSDDGTRYKHYYVLESVGIAIGMLITALHHSGLVCLEHTPNPMNVFNSLCQRPPHEKPMMIIPTGYPSQEAMIPQAAKIKKPLAEIMSVF